MSRCGFAEATTIERNTRLVKIYGLSRAGYTSKQIGHILGLHPTHVSNETAIARRCTDELLNMLAGCREWDHVFPRRDVAA